MLVTPTPPISSVSCPAIRLSQDSFETFETTDAEYPGKLFDIETVESIDGSSCRARTRDGTAIAANGQCIDFGVSSVDDTPSGASIEDPHPLTFLPSARPLPTPPSFTARAAKMQEYLARQQFVANNHGCGLTDAPEWRKMYYVHLVPQLGFGSVIEYAMMFLARATHMKAQLVLGPTSSPVWTSSWACGSQRSLTCYFNISSCCGALVLNNRPLELPRRRNPLNLGLPGYDRFGALWIAGQLAHFFFVRMTPGTRTAVDARRANVWPRGGLPAAGGGVKKCIGMHIRGGDSCHARRFCPKNLTATFFTQAARFRSLYGVNTIVLATDSTRAAAECAKGVLGFECRTMAFGRDKFESPTFIEQRVASHSAGELSGSTVALDALADVDMLADCDYHVLILRSAISRLAYGLSTARHGRPTPVVSMQWPYSPTFMKLKSPKKMGMKKAFKGRNAMKMKRMMAKTAKMEKGSWKLP